MPSLDTLTLVLIEDLQILEQLTRGTSNDAVDIRRLDTRRQEQGQVELGGGRRREGGILRR